jgi:hypothetical protein
MASKRDGWNGNEASRDERQERPPFDWVTDLDADFCDRHETAFRVGDGCPVCKHSTSNPKAYDEK